MKRTVLAGELMLKGKCRNAEAEYLLNLNPTSIRLSSPIIILTDNLSFVGVDVSRARLSRLLRRLCRISYPSLVSVLA